MNHLSLTSILVKSYMTVSLLWAKADTLLHKVKDSDNTTGTTLLKQARIA